MNKLISFLLLVTSLAHAGLPPTTKKGQTDATNVTTFFTAFPNETVYHNGVTGTITRNGKMTKNYIQYADFENNAVTGWSTAHSALSGTTPTSIAAAGTAFDSSHGGTAASVNLTFTASNSAPLSGTYSGLLNSSAASVAGDLLISSAFSIDTADFGKVLQVRFPWVNGSGTAFNASGTSSNTFAIWIYDVTSAAWVQPAGVYNMLCAQNVYCETLATFQTSVLAGQKYQIALVNINATAGSYNFIVDDFLVGPQKSAQGPAMSDPVAYTPTLGPAFGAATGISAEYRMIGSYLYVHGYFTAGTVTAGLNSVTLPAGMNIDTSIITIANTTSGGGQSIGAYGGAGANGSGHIVTALGTSTSTVYFGNEYASANGPLVPASGAVTVNSGGAVSYSFSVPISGKSSNSSMSSDTDTRVVAAKVNYSGAGTVAGSGTGTVPYANVLYDTHGAYNSGTFTYTVPVSGKYRVTSAFTVTTASTTSGQSTVSVVVKNGSVDSSIAQCQVRGGSGGATYCSGSTVIDCKAGDTLLIQQQNNTGGTNTYDATVADNWVSYERLSGPAVVSASESVNMRYKLVGTSALTQNVETIVKYDTKEWDTHNAYSVSTGLYTAPLSGTYQVDGACPINSSGGRLVVDIYKNGALDFGGQDGTITGSNTQIVAGMVHVNAGDTIDVHVFTSLAGNSCVAGGHIAIARLGN